MTRRWTLILAAIAALTALSFASPLGAADRAGKRLLTIDIVGNLSHPKTIAVPPGPVAGAGAGAGTFALDG